MNEPKGWVHWHPDGYVLDVDDDKALGMKDAGVFHDIGAAERWVNVCSEYKKTLVGACDVITFEEAAKRLAQAAMKATEAEAYAQQERSLRGETKKPTEGRMMVEFRLDPSKYRVRVRPSGALYRAFVQTREPDVLIGQCTSDVATMAVGTAIESANAPPPGRLLPHPWKRADGSHIKAEWEE